MFIIELIAQSLVQGSIYALIALGLTLVMAYLGFCMLPMPVFLHWAYTWGC